MLTKLYFLMAMLTLTSGAAMTAITVEDVVIIAVSTSLPFAAGYLPCSDLSGKKGEVIALSTSDVDLGWVEEHEVQGQAACYNCTKSANTTTFSIRNRLCMGLHQASQILFCKASALYELPAVFETHNGSFLDVVSEVNNEEMFAQVLRMAELGAADFQAAAGWFYEHGSPFVGQTTENARRWYKRAADQGHIESSVRYFTLEVLRAGKDVFDNGKNKNLNFASLLQFLLDTISSKFEPILKNAALKGHSEAQFYFALIHLRSSANISEVWEYLRRSAEGGFSPAQILLATLYADGPREKLTLLASPEASVHLIRRFSTTSRGDSALLWLLRAFKDSKDPLAAIMLLLMENDLTNDQRSQIADVVMGPPKSGFGTWREVPFADRYRQAVTLLRTTAKTWPRMYAFFNLVSDLEGTGRRNDTWLLHFFKSYDSYIASPLGLLYIIADEMRSSRHISAGVFMDEIELFKSFHTLFGKDGRSILPLLPSLLLHGLHKSEMIFTTNARLFWMPMMMNEGFKSFFGRPATAFEAITAFYLRYSAEGSSIADLALYLQYKTKMIQGELGEEFKTYILEGLQRAVDQGICASGFCAFTELAEVLEKDVLFPLDLERSKELYVQAKLSNDPYALFRLGIMSDHPRVALRYFAHAAVHGSLDAFVQLAKAFTIGKYITADLALAGSLVKAVADPSYVTSKEIDWADVLRKVDNATSEFREEIPLNDPSLSFLLIPIRSTLTHTDKMFVKGMALNDYRALLETAKMGYAEAQRLAVMKGLLFRHPPREVDLTKEVWTWIQKEANAGDFHMTCMEYFLWPGPTEEGAEKRNIVFSLDRIKELADRNCADAQYSLFVKYRDGESVPKNETIALYYAEQVINTWHHKSGVANRFVRDSRSLSKIIVQYFYYEYISGAILFLLLALGILVTCCSDRRY